MSTSILIIYKVVIMIQIITNITLASGTIIIALFAFLTWRQSLKLSKEERESRRAYLVPQENPGQLVLDDDILNDEPRLKIFLKNYGRNPLKNIELNLLSYNSADINGENPIEHIRPIINAHFSGVNPVPHDAEFAVLVRKQKLQEMNINDFTIMLTNYLYLKLNYHDMLLDQEFPDQFYWRIDNGNLVEITQREKNKIDELIKFYETQRL